MTDKETEIKSPFKFLDAYGEEDRDVYFGRESEIEELYDRVFETNLILLYGASGTGKTSLIYCGLASQFNPSDWLPVSIRRHENLLDSLEAGLERYAITPFSAGATLAAKLRSLYLDYYRPIYLIFDQFEEIFTLGVEEEQVKFFTTIRDLLLAGLQIKALISMRGEYLDQLSKYELIIPSLFDNRFFLERMSRRQLQSVVRQNCLAFNIGLENETIAKEIVDNITDQRGGVELANLQIYLDKLFRNDWKRRGRSERPIRFDRDLLAQTRQLEDVLSVFLKEQLALLEKELVEKFGLRQKNVPMDVLFALVTEEGAKKNMKIEDLRKRLERRKNITPDIFDYCLQRLNELRILRLTGEVMSDK